MSTDATDEGRPSDAATGEEQEWGKIGLAVVVSVVVAVAVHYLVVAPVEMHPSLHALVGIVLFFLAGLVMFKLVLF